MRDINGHYLSDQKREGLLPIFDAGLALGFLFTVRSSRSSNKEKVLPFYQILRESDSDLLPYPLSSVLALSEVDLSKSSGDIHDLLSQLKLGPYDIEDVIESSGGATLETSTYPLVLGGHILPPPGFSASETEHLTDLISATENINGIISISERDRQSAFHLGLWLGLLLRSEEEN
jgi:hypothetical protein